MNEIKEIKLENLGTVNKNVVRIETDKGFIDLFFSYKTIIGFMLKEKDKMAVNKTIKNYWGVTTGKFLNILEPDKSKRLEDKTFYKELNKAFKKIGLKVGGGIGE